MWAGKGARTSEAHPIRVDFLTPEMLGLSGRLGMTIGPGIKGDATGGRWERDLDVDLARITQYYGADVLVSLMEPDECARTVSPICSNAPVCPGWK